MINNTNEEDTMADVILLQFSLSSPSPRLLQRVEKTPPSHSPALASLLREMMSDDNCLCLLLLLLKFSQMIQMDFC